MPHKRSTTSEEPGHWKQIHTYLTEILTEILSEILTEILTTPGSDQYINSPKNFNTLPSKHVMRIKIIINYGVLFGYNTKFSGLANKEMYGHQLGEVAFISWE